MMTGMVIKVSTERMRAAADSVESKMNVMRDSFDELDSIMRNCTSYWEGDGADHYRQVYDSYKDDISEVLARLREQIMDLRQMAGIYEQTEQTNTSKGASLPDDVIS